MPKVLIIDSDTEVTAALSEALHARSVSTKVIADGAEGLKLAKDEQPDAIVLCVELSRVSGYSICNKLKKSPDLAKIPLILTSDKATEETFEQHKKLKTRAEQYLKKPFDMEQMLGLLAQYIDIDAGDDEMEVAFNDVEVEVGSDGNDDAMEISLDGEADSLQSLGSSLPSGLGDGMVEGAATTVMQLPPGFAEELAARTQNRPKSQPAPRPDSSPVLRTDASDANTERLRAEIRQLRQKVQKLETTLQEKEEEFTDRLLQESTRSRESIDLKKKLNQVERELEKYRQAADKAEERATASETQIRNIMAEMNSAGQEKEQLSEKLSQLVDKLKSLAAERDALKAELDSVKQSQAAAEESVAQAEQVRAKAKKAVDIAMQLLNETGLMH